MRRGEALFKVPERSVRIEAEDCSMDEQLMDSWWYGDVMVSVLAEFFHRAEALGCLKIKHEKVRHK